MKRAVGLIGDVIAKHFSERRTHLELLMELGATSEEWFRIELLFALTAIPDVSVTRTNRRHEEKGRERPDFVIQLQGREALFELKVLPSGGNYPRAWQRFQAGANNKNDFEKLANRQRDGIVYCYWPDEALWQDCSDHLRSNYSVQCVREDRIACRAGSVIVSYWAASG